jgi:hypothetical protein
MIDQPRTISLLIQKESERSGPRVGLESAVRVLERVKIFMDYVRFEVFTAVTMKNGVFWVVTP